jgi:hypothetical protein
MINRRFDDRVSCPAWKSPTQALARKPRIHSPASGNGGHESVLIGAGLGILIIGRMGKKRVAAFIALFPEPIDLMVRTLRCGLPIGYVEHEVW